jgi:hypothetical protein
MAARSSEQIPTSSLGGRGPMAVAGSGSASAAARAGTSPLPPEFGSTRSMRRPAATRRSASSPPRPIHPTHASGLAEGYRQRRLRLGRMRLLRRWLAGSTLRRERRMTTNPLPRRGGHLWGPRLAVSLPAASRQVSRPPDREGARSEDPAPNSLSAETASYGQRLPLLYWSSVFARLFAWVFCAFVRLRWVTPLKSTAANRA